MEEVEKWLISKFGSCKKEKLSGGNLNFVWRITKEDDVQNTVILKYAPPFIASKPEIPLDSKRIEFEAHALEFIQAFANDEARSPKLISFEPKLNAILMEDINQSTDLNSFISQGGNCDELGSRIGRFIGKLHSTTFGKKELLQNFNNIGIQQARLQILYKSVSTFLHKLKEPQAELISSRASSLGEKLASNTGICLTMGDLWPPSILIKDGNVRIIDWEFAHYGFFLFYYFVEKKRNPIQDIAHLVSHLWMLEHVMDSSLIKENIHKVRKDFLISYKKELTKNNLNLFTKEFVEDCNVHFGCELLMRTIGTFKENYIYEKFTDNSEKIKEAVDIAIKHMLSENKENTFVIE